MSKLTWDSTENSKHVYETGVKNCVLYVKNSTGYDKGVAWNGIQTITESPSGAEATALYADDRKYAELTSAEEFGASIEAYMYPDEFAACNGVVEVDGVLIGQQTRKAFGLSYITTKGSSDEGNDYGYIVHIVYNAKAAPSEKAYASINDSPEAMTFSWELTTTPVDPGVTVEGKALKPTAHIEIDSTKVPAEKMTALLEKLHGSESEEAALPTIKDVVELLKAAA